jgi:hypothetical protein
MRAAGRRAGTQIDRGRHDQHHVEQRDQRQHDCAGTPLPGRIAQDEADSEEHPQPDLAAGYEPGHQMIPHDDTFLAQLC